ncbi:hypothetical protein IIY24_01985 [Candidatus Saccharibacteria bacterium]|nr:hypothetical protein [Candidatus Saccharibacteria bacterium]
MFFVFIFSPPTSALTYQEDVPVSFTFNRSISVAVSSDLHIYNLTPGTNADSNIITVSTATNNATGYVLSATVGNGTHTNPTYNTTNITNKDNSSFAFSSLATNSSLANMSNSTDNTWGYSFSQDNGTNWTNYSGLPIYTGTPKELISTNSNAGINIKFKIGAKASTDQPSGEYTNIINFTAVANSIPVTIDDLTYLQDFGSLTSDQQTEVETSMTLDTQYILKDSRDQQNYTIAKLSDGNIWMTKNLNLAGGTTVTSEDSNVTVDYTLPNSSTNWTTNLMTSHVYNSGSTTCVSNSPCYSYYSSRAREGGNQNYNKGRDICPKGWRVPVSSEFTALKNIYTTGASLTAEPFSGNYSGYYYGSTTYQVGTFGYYQASDTDPLESMPYHLKFSNDSATIDYPPQGSNRGFPIRCLVKE